MEHPYTELAPVYELFDIPRLSRAYYNRKKKTKNELSAFSRGALLTTAWWSLRIFVRGKKRGKKFCLDELLQK